MSLQTILDIDLESPFGRTPIAGSLVNPVRPDLRPDGRSERPSAE